MSPSSSNSEDVVNGWLARYEDELMRSPITPEDFQRRERLVDLLPMSQFEELKRGLRLAYTESLRLQQTAIVIKPKEPDSADELEQVRVEFADRFEIEGLIGKGGFGSVYLAKEIHESFRLVALKVLDHRFVQERFSREIRLASLFSHPHLIRILSSGETDRMLYYCMPYFQPLQVDGPFAKCVTLNDVLDRKQNLQVPIQEVASLMRDVVSGLETLHDPQLQRQYVNANDFQKLRRVIHRDIKPGNVLLTQTPQRVMCVLADFGLAKIVDDSRDLTKGVDFLGTRNYAPPEQVYDFKSTDVRSDIYSVGATFYKFVTNRFPLQVSDSTSGSTANQSQREPIPVRECNAQVDVRFEAILRKCLRYRPEDRYQSSHDLLSDLENYLAGKAVDAPLLSSWQRMTDRFHRNRRKLFRTALITSLLFIAVGASYTAYHFRLKPAGKVIIPVIPPTNVAKQFRDLKTAIDQGAVAQAMSHWESLPDSADGWLKSYLHGRLADLPQIDEIVADHDWGVTDILVGDSGLLSTGLDQRLQFTPHDIDKELVTASDLVLQENVINNPTDSLVGWGSKQFDIKSGTWIQEPGLWSPAFHPQQPQQLLPESDCIVAMDWSERNRVVVAACWSGRGIRWSRADGGRFSSTDILTHAHPLTAVASRESVHLFGDTLGQLIFMDADQQQVHNILNESPITAIVVVNEKSWLIGQANGTLSLLDETCEQVLDTLQFPSQILDIQRSPSGAIAVASGSKVTVLDVENRLQTRPIVFQLPVSDATRDIEFQAVCFDQSEECVVAGDSLGQLTAWNLIDGSIISHELAFKHGFQQSLTDQLPTPLAKRMTAIRRIPNDNAFYVAGWNGLVETWRFKARQSATTVAAGTVLDGCFLDKNRLLFLNADGSLSMFAATTGELIQTQQLSVTAPTGFSRLNDSTLFVWNAEGIIFEVHLNNEQQNNTTNVLFQSEYGVEALVSNSTGDRLYFYDREGSVYLWQRDQNKIIAQFQKREQQLPRQFVMTYSQQLNQVAISGEGQAVHVLDGSTLSLIRSPNLAAGSGCTHLTWAGVESNILFAGDSEGILRAVNMSDGLYPGIERYTLAAPLAGIVASTDGQEVFAITTTGVIRCLEAETGQFRCDLRAPESNSTTQIQRAIFDPTSQHLALLSKSGHSVVLHGTKPRRLQQPQRVTTWKHKTLWSDPNINWIRTREVAVRLNSENHLALLYSTRSKNADVEQLWFAREDVQQLVTQTIAETDLTGLKDHRDYERSVSLLLTDSSIRGVYRQRLGQGYEGGLNGIEWKDDESVPKSWFENVVTGNLGFENHIVTGKQGQQRILTFEHAYRGLLMIDPQAATQQRVGRQGDGLYFHAVSQHGQTDAVSIPNRLNSEPFRVWHYKIETSSNPISTQRRVIDAHSGARPDAILRHENELLVLVRRQNQQRQQVFVLLRGISDEWTEQTLSVPANLLKISNLCMTSHGRCLFAYIDAKDQLVLCTVDATGDISTELISEGPLQETFRSMAPQCLVLRLTREEQPLICFLADGPNGSSISTYLRDEN